MSDVNLTISDMIKAIDPTLNVITTRKEEKINPQFYVHINRRRLQITAITRQKLEYDPEADVFSKEIDYELAEKFLTGAENPTRWAVIYDDVQKAFTIIRDSELKKNKTDRISAMSIYEVTEDFSFADVDLELDYQNSLVKIHYIHDRVFKWDRAVKIYFTRDGDPSHLKCAFTLDANILNKLTEANNLTDWPNPITIGISDMHDMSIYAVKSDLRIAKHEKINY